MEDQVGSDEGRDEGPDGVEGLGEVEPAGGRGCRPDDGDVRIQRNLHDGDARGEDDQGGEKEGERWEMRGGEESDCARGHDEQAYDHGLFVAEALDQLACGVAEDKVGGEEEE